MNASLLRPLSGFLTAFAALYAIGLASASSDSISPITVKVGLGTLSPSEGTTFATFANRQHPGNRIGYRFFEHVPLIHGGVPASAAEAGIDPEETARQEKSFASREDVVIYPLDISQSDWPTEHWKFYLAPVADGIDLLWVVETENTGLSRYFGVQQCFRMSGATNTPSRRKIAETPAFSEFDLWNGLEKATGPRTSLTYVRRNGAWVTLPAGLTPVGARTPLGVRVDTDITGGDLAAMRDVGAYHARLLEPVDSGLIARTSMDRTWISGIYWERTSHLTDHQPADCVHSIVNLGGIPPHSKRALRGKIYWFKGTLDDLMQRWQRDFPAE